MRQGRTKTVVAGCQACRIRMVHRGGFCQGLLCGAREPGRPGRREGTR